METIVCKNCDQTFQGEYCNRCGQKAFKRLSRTYLWHGLREDLFNIDGGLLLTFKELWTHPGIMVINYIRGRSRRYYSPLRYLFFWTALYLLVVAFTMHAVPWDSLRGLIISSNGPFSTITIDVFTTFLLAVMTTHTDVYFLGILPFLSSANYLFHRTGDFNLVEILVLHTYFLGQFACAMIVLSLFNPWLRPITIFGWQLTDALSFVPYFYLFFKMQKEFFGETWKTAIVKGLLVWTVGTFSYFVFLFILFNGLKYALYARRREAIRTCRERRFFFP